jgi:catechol 2,3-dioxygenase
MGHIHLSIADLAASEAFYTAALGFDVVARYGMQALFISTGKYHHHIGLNTWHSAGGVKAPENNVGLKSYTLVLADEAHAQKVKTDLNAAGAVIEEYSEAPAFGGKQVFSTVDPSGIRIVFTLDGE